MLLRDKTAMVYGAGDIGGAVAHAFAAEGARVHLASRTEARAAAVAGAIRAAGGQATAAEIDALDEAAVARHADMAVRESGGIDISFNAIGLGDTQGAYIIETPMDKVMGPTDIAIRSHTIIARVLTPHMARRGGGVIMGITANVARMAVANVAGFAMSCAATESLFRQFACELGERNIRAVILRSAGSPDASGVSAAFDMRAREQGITRAEFETKVTAEIPLRRLPRIAEVTALAPLLASDRASAVTGAVINVTCGAMVD